ncbi:MAG: hypothetical protein ACI308_02725, partial [Muribaculaceae bacterium]
MMTKNKILFAVLAWVCAFVAVAQPVAPQYENPDCWWNGAEGFKGHDVDVFYVLPTCVGAWQDSCGVMQFN